MQLKTMNKLLILTYIFAGIPDTASADLFKCTACPAGYRCDGTSKYKCDAGTYAYAGSASCTPCPAGYRCDGTYQYRCTGNTYAYGTGNRYCSDCPTRESCIYEYTVTKTVDNYSECYSECMKVPETTGSQECNNHCKGSTKKVSEKKTTNGYKKITSEANSDNTSCVVKSRGNCERAW